MVWAPELTSSSDWEETYQTINRSFLDDGTEDNSYVLFKNALKFPIFPNNDNK